MSVGKFFGFCMFASILISEGMPEAIAQSSDELTARGLVRSQARVEVRTDLNAPVLAAKYHDGMRFMKDDELIAFDCSRQQAELNAAKAAARSAAIELQNQRSLRANGAAGKNEVLVAKANANKAQEDANALNIRLSGCSIKAPFSGRMVSLNVKAHERPSASEPLMVILNDNALELELVLPSHWLSWLTPNAEFAFQIDETGKSYLAKLTRLGAEVDPVSQTIKAYGALSGELHAVLAGMSGTARFSRPGS